MTLTRSELEPLCERRKCSLGECVVVSSILLIDERPEILASGLPVWLESEWASLIADPDCRVARWNARREAMDEERELRRADDKRRALMGLDLSGIFAGLWPA